LYPVSKLIVTYRHCYRVLILIFERLRYVERDRYANSQSFALSASTQQTQHPVELVEARIAQRQVTAALLGL